MPNPWDVGSARLLESAGFEALATTSAGFAWSIGRLDQAVTRDELIAHVASVVAATSVPLNVDSERCYPDDPGGVAETVALLAGAGVAELASVGVRRVATGGSLASAAYGALVFGARELLADGTSTYAQPGVPRDALTAAFTPEGAALRTDR